MFKYLYILNIFYNFKIISFLKDTKEEVDENM